MWCYINIATKKRRFTPPDPNFPFPTMVPDGWNVQWNPLLQTWSMINNAQPGRYPPKPIAPLGWRVEWDQVRNVWVYINLATGNRQYRLPPPNLAPHPPQGIKMWNPLDQFYSSYI